MAKFKNGDRVVIAEKYMLAQKGWIGTVLSYHKTESEYVAVSIDNFADGHDCDGFVEKFRKPPKSGYWIVEERLQLLTEETKPEPVKPKPAKPKPWFSPGGSDLDEILGMSVEIKPASERYNCCKCAAYQQIADCEYGFCSSWHNFAGKDELCARFKAVETVDK